MKKLLLIAVLFSTFTVARGVTTQLNVLSFGARGNDSADDTDAIQQAFNAASRLGPTQGSLYMPAGVYRTTRTLIITNGFSIIGDSRIGATSFSPVSYIGPMIRYYGNSGPAIHIQKPGGIVYKLDIRGVRIGNGNSGFAVDGIVMDDVSEFTLTQINVNGGFRRGLVINGCTIGSVNDSDFSANEIAIDMGDSDIIGYSQNISFTKLNAFICAKAAFRATTSLRAANFRDCWFEYCQNGFLFHPTNYVANTVMGVDSILIDGCSVRVGDTNTYPQSRSIVLDANSTSNALHVTGIKVSNCVFYNPGSRSAVEVLMGSNTNGITLMEGLRIEDTKAYSVTNSMVYSDWQNANIEVGGYCRTMTSFGEGTELPTFSGTGKFFNNLIKFDHRDMTGLPIKLPSTAPNSWDEGYFTYNSFPGVKRPQWYNGTDVIQIPSGNGEGAVRLPVYQNPGFISNPSRGLLACADGLNWDPLARGDGPYLVVYNGTNYVSPTAGVTVTNTWQAAGTNWTAVVRDGSLVSLSSSSGVNANFPFDVGIGGNLIVSGSIAASTLGLSQLNTASLTSTNGVRMLSQSTGPTAGTIGAGNGQLWLSNSSPPTLYFRYTTDGVSATDKLLSP